MTTLRGEFDRVWPWLEKAVSHSREPFTAEEVWQRIEDDMAQLWSAHDAAAVTTIQVFPNGQKAVQIWLAGGSMDSVIRITGFVEEWAKLKGAKSVTIVGRRGWLRALDGYDEVATCMMKELKQ
jgi:hypothetical protein